MGSALIAILALLPAVSSVDIEGHALRLPVLLASLSESTGVKLSCSSEFQDRVVFASAHGMEADAALSALARAVDGKWEKAGDGRTLVADLSSRSARRAAFLELVAADMREIVEETRASVPKEFDHVAALALVKKIEEFDPEKDYRAGEAIAAQSPVGRLLFTLLSRVDMKKCAALGPNELYLTSSQRSLFFEPLTVGATTLRTFDKEQAVWDQYSSSSRSGMRSSSLFAAEHSTSELPAGRVFIGLSRYSALTNFVASLVVLDTTGQVKGIARFNVFPKGHERALAQPPIDASGPEANIHVSERAKAYLKTFAFDASFTQLTPSDPLYREFLDPVEHEPLDYWIGDLLQPLGKNVFAALDDGLYYDFNSVLLSGQVSPAGLATLLKDRSQYEVAREGDTTVVRPYDPERPADKTLSRTLLRKMMLELNRQGFVSVDTLLEFAKTGVSNMATNALLFYHSRAIVPGYERLLQFLETTSLRVLASFAPQERRLLDNGQTLSFGQLTPATQRTLSALIGQNIVWDSGRDDVLVPRELRLAVKFPNGIPATMQFHALKKGDVGMAVWNAANDEYTAWTTFGPPSRVAGSVQSFKRKGIESRFWFGSAVDVSLEASDNGVQIGQSDIFIPLFDLRKEQPKLEDLPEDVRQMISGG